jgi:hypothetical protein
MHLHLPKHIFLFSPVHAHTLTTHETNASTHKDFKQNRNLGLPTALKQTRLFGHRNQENETKFNRFDPQMSSYFLSEAVATKDCTQTLLGMKELTLPRVRFTPWNCSSSVFFACWVGEMCIAGVGSKASLE